MDFTPINPGTWATNYASGVKGCPKATMYKSLAYSFLDADGVEGSDKVSSQPKRPFTAPTLGKSQTKPKSPHRIYGQGFDKYTFTIKGFRTPLTAH